MKILIRILQIWLLICLNFQNLEGQNWNQSYRTTPEGSNISIFTSCSIFVLGLADLAHMNLGIQSQVGTDKYNGHNTSVLPANSKTIIRRATQIILNCNLTYFFLSLDNELQLRNTFWYMIKHMENLSNLESCLPRTNLDNKMFLARSNLSKKSCLPGTT
jgi:hypothetical protein